MPALADMFLDLGIALALGLFVGLQRERTESTLAGIRTFPLITVLGAMVAFLCQALASSWPLVAGLVAVAAIVAVGFVAKLRLDASDVGATTEFAILVMYLLGALVVLAPNSLAVAVGVGVAILLQLKPELHGLAARMGDRDLRAIMQFALVTFIVLPVLPARVPGLPDAAPFNVLNPREIWWMVVLIVGISLAGYLLYRYVGEQIGVIAAGLLGGAISSTATTFSFARRAKEDERSVPVSAFVVILASSVVYFRVLLEIAVVELAGVSVGGWDQIARSAPLLVVASRPLGLLALATVIPAVVVWLTLRRQRSAMPVPANPSELKSALFFAALYAIVLFGLEIAGQYAPRAGPFVVAGLSGMTDMDAITLSSARLVKAEQLEVDRAWRVIVVAILANLLFKLGIVGLIGGVRLLKWCVPLLAVPLVAGVVLLVIW